MDFILKIAENDEELKQYYSVRKEIFVKEQGIFSDQDQDEHDACALHIIGVERTSGKIVGVVRCYPLGNGDWMGGRLAVLPDYRRGLGTLLVRKAMEEVHKRGCRNFYAHIQEQNVTFFQRLGWTLGSGKMILGGVLHYDMQVIFDNHQEIRLEG